MAIYSLYSTRNKSTPDIFTYDILPEKLKVQAIRIWDKFYDQEFDEPFNYDKWGRIKEILCDAYGLFRLIHSVEIHNRIGGNNRLEVQVFFENCTEIEKCLDVLELVFTDINNTVKSNIYGEYPYYPDEAIQDLNTRFLENGVGYEFRDREIIRVDNKLLHREIIAPTLSFLSIPEFKNANEEFLNAHEHFRHQQTKACLVDCLKAMESTLKVICDLNKWPYKQTDNVNKLVTIVIEHKLIPDFLLQHFSSLRSTLEGGVPTIRNKMAGHGAGVEEIKVPMHYASYILYLTGTTINFLVSCQKEIPS